MIYLKKVLFIINIDIYNEYYYLKKDILYLFIYLKQLFFFTHILSLVNFGNTQESYQKRIQLREDIFSDYCSESLPTDIGDTLNVSLGVALRAFKSIDQLDGTISASAAK